ncbi:MAG: beta-galactosidase [Phycisphaeraceae bacterium]|nr:beta-galactosidase [Phycisphaeraceae bacterium]
MPRLPQLGANVMFTEAPHLTDHFLKTLRDHHMPVARFFIDTDFPLHDKVFDAAARHGVALCPTLPAPKDPMTEAQLHKLDETIGEIVTRYKDHPALDTWILLNEPKQNVMRSELSQRKLKEWLVARYGSPEAALDAWSPASRRWTDLDQVVARDAIWRISIPYFELHVRQIDVLRFMLDYHTWYMAFLADCVRRRDSAHPTHANPDQLAVNLVTHAYDLPAWRDSMDSLGVTLHPAWTYGRFGKRDRYAMAFSYQCEVVRGAAEPHPFWITELQSGTNIYDALDPLCPSSADMAQWTWLTIAGGAQRSIYWCLNTRVAGWEAGGWGLLDYQHQPSDRLETAGQIASIIEKEADFFDGATPIETPITILLGLEAMAVECFYGQQDLPGRSRDAHTDSARGFYEVLCELGIPARVKHLHDFDFDRAYETRQLLILPNLLAMSQTQAAALTAFVKKGHTVLATGQTGMYGERAELWPTWENYPLLELLGGTIRDMRFVGEEFPLSLDDPALTLPAHLLQGEIRPIGGTVIGRDGARVTAMRNRCGHGEAIWIPSLIGLGAWLGDNQPLVQLMQAVAGPLTTHMPFRFAAHTQGCLMRVMSNGSRCLTVVTNGSTERRSTSILHNHAAPPRLIWCGGDSAVTGRGDVSLDPRQTVVMLWP